MSSVLASQEQLLQVWQQHTYSEFVLRDAPGALMTMTENPYVLMVPLALGGQGAEVAHTLLAWSGKAPTA